MKFNNINNIYIFRNDLRLEDNIAFINFVSLMKKLNKNFIPLFIFDNYQINSNHFSNNSFNFLIESLVDLDKQLKKYYDCNLFIYLLNNSNYNLNDFLRIFNNKIDYLGFNLDYSPYSLYRDEILKNICNNLIIYENNNFLNEKELFLKSNNQPYEVFGAYLKSSKSINIRNIKKNNIIFNNKIKIESPFHSIDEFNIKNKSNLIKLIGGRTNGLLIIKKILSNSYYLNLHRRIDKNKTLLSAYLKYGCLSIVEVYKKFKQKKIKYLIEQLHWRNFYMVYSYKINQDFFINNILNKNNNIINIIDKNKLKLIEENYYNNSGNSFFNNLKWENNYDLYKKMWIDAKTGFELIDASVRCLNETGLIPNRCRLLLGYFSCKILHINPFHPIIGGQIEFSKKLIDCCYSNNVLNWRFVLSSQFDNTSFRFGTKGTKEGRTYDVGKKSIKKYDPNLDFINKWIPLKYFDNNKNYLIKPIVDINKRKEKWIIMTKLL